VPGPSSYYTAHERDRNYQGSRPRTVLLVRRMRRRTGPTRVPGHVEAGFATGKADGWLGEQEKGSVR
jgi:hypothetical protein